MSQIDELQDRILAAMDRISAGAEAVSNAQGAARAADDTLAMALDEEKMANAQLEERLRVLKAQHAEELAALEGQASPASAEPEIDSAELDGLRDQLDRQAEDMTAQAKAMAELDGDLQRLRTANDELRAANMALRAANEAGVGEPHLINKAMLAELEGLRAAQTSQAAEASAVLARIGPLLANVQNMPEGEEL